MSFWMLVARADCQKERIPQQHWLQSWRSIVVELAAKGPIPNREFTSLASTAAFNSQFGTSGLASKAKGVKGSDADKVSRLSMTESPLVGLAVLEYSSTVLPGGASGS